MSFIMFVYIVSAAVGLLVLLSIKLYSEGSQYTEKLQFHLQQKTVASNLAQAKLAVLNSKHKELKLQTNDFGKEKLEALNQEIIDLKKSLNQEKENLESMVKEEKEMAEFTLLNFNEMESLNKTISTELSQAISLNKELKSDVEKNSELNKDLKRQIKEALDLNKSLVDKTSEVAEFKKIKEDEIKKLEEKLSEVSRDRKTLLTKLVGFESREELLQSKVSEKDKQLQTFDVKLKNQNLMVEFLNSNISDKNKIMNELKEKVEMLNGKLAEEQKKLSAHEKIDTINRRDVANKGAKIDFEKTLVKRVLKSYSMILNLEKKNMLLKSELKEQRNTKISVDKNVIPFPTNVERNKKMQTVAAINNIQSLIKENKIDSGVIEHNELQFLKAKLDEARKSLFEMQSLSDQTNKKVRSVA